MELKSKGELKEIVLSDAQKAFIIERNEYQKIYAKEQNSKNFDIQLEGLMIPYVPKLFQCNNKMVYFKESRSPSHQIGIFRITELNGVENPDLSDIAYWREIKNFHIESIKMQFYTESYWGGNGLEWNSIFSIKEIARFKEQV